MKDARFLNMRKKVTVIFCCNNHKWRRKLLLVPIFPSIPLASYAKKMLVPFCLVFPSFTLKWVEWIKSISWKYSCVEEYFIQYSSLLDVLPWNWLVPVDLYLEAGGVPGQVGWYAQDVLVVDGGATPHTQRGMAVQTWTLSSLILQMKWYENLLNI